MPNPRNIYEVRDCGYASPCWLWQGCRVKGGYCQTRVEGRSTYAHRYMFEMHRGPIPDGLQLDHLCRNRTCVNPDHLEPVTNAQNAQRGKVIKLNPAKVRAIRYLATTGLSNGAIAKRFGVSPTTVWEVRHRLTWREA